jgi:hypothetical protein
MKNPVGKTVWPVIILALASCLVSYAAASGQLVDERPSGRRGTPLFTVEDMRYDFDQLRRILENEHCCLYEYTGKSEFDALFDARSKLIDRPMGYEDFFRIIAPLAAKVGCMYTALYASVFGFPEKYSMTYALSGRKTRLTADIQPTEKTSGARIIGLIATAVNSRHWQKGN